MGKGFSKFCDKVFGVVETIQKKYSFDTAGPYAHPCHIGSYVPDHCAPDKDGDWLDGDYTRRSLSTVTSGGNNALSSSHKSIQGLVKDDSISWVYLLGFGLLLVVLIAIVWKRLRERSERKQWIVLQGKDCKKGFLSEVVEELEDTAV